MKKKLTPKHKLIEALKACGIEHKIENMNGAFITITSDESGDERNIYFHFDPDGTNPFISIGGDWPANERDAIRLEANATYEGDQMEPPLTPGELKKLDVEDAE